MRRLFLAFLALLAVLFSTGCRTSVHRLGIALYYEETTLAEENVLFDQLYGREDLDKQRLDLFLPATSANWPTMIFVHGGGWTEGDRAARFGGADIYRNVGRFYASHGVGVAVISYRLQPRVTWRQQVEDVAGAIAWAHRHIAEHGGDPARLIVAGHSAGAHLATRVKLDPQALAAVGVPEEAVCGVVAVSGAGYDLVDRQTYRLGARLSWYEKRFRTAPEDVDWQRSGSSIALVRPELPPFLLMYSAREWRSLEHQNQLLDRALEAAAVDSRLVEIDGESHARMVLAMSRPKDRVSAAVLRFLADACDVAPPTWAVADESKRDPAMAAATSPE